MGAQSRPVGRPSKNTLRVELRLNRDDEAVKRLVEEAAARGVTLQQHITDILIVRYLNEPTPPDAPAQRPNQGGAASALADEFM